MNAHNKKLGKVNFQEKGIQYVYSTKMYRNQRVTDILWLYTKEVLEVDYICK